MAKDVNINFDIKKLPSLLKSFVAKFRKYAFAAYIFLVVAVSGYLVFQVNSLLNKEPTPEQIAEQQNSIKRPKIDQETISKIESLEDQNIGVKSLFRAARDNPFKDD